MVMVEHVGEHQRGALEPRQAAQGRHVGLHDEIAVALLPARRRVAGHRLHVDVVGEQVVAAVRLLVRAVDEKFRLEALADEAALHVDHGDDHGVDRAGRDGFLQVIERQITRHARSPLRRAGKRSVPAIVRRARRLRLCPPYVVFTRFSMKTLNGSGL